MPDGGLRRHLISRASVSGTRGACAALLTVTVLLFCLPGNMVVHYLQGLITIAKARVLTTAQTSNMSDITLLHSKNWSSSD
jgi:hypothetical protein